MRALANLSGEERIVVAAGRLSPEKGFDVLVEAAGLLRQQHSDLRFVLFGEGAERPLLERRIQELNLQGSFILAGFRDDLDRWLPWADVVVLPSFTEGLPNVALEASAAGVPVVATAVGGTPEVLRHGETGFLVPSGNPAELAKRIAELGGDADLRQSM
ncbi:MAG: glycosyltransferase, partial [Planctomycetes bacterium]|nr:glycosyltransferase [Planctomycetota bacterium]